MGLGIGELLVLSVCALLSIVGLTVAGVLIAVMVRRTLRTGPPSDGTGGE